MVRTTLFIMLSLGFKCSFHLSLGKLNHQSHYRELEYRTVFDLSRCEEGGSRCYLIELRFLLSANFNCFLSLFMVAVLMTRLR